MKTVAVIFGGRSTEHDVSIITALGRVIKPLEMSGEYRVEAVYIAKDGSWYWGDELKDIKLFQSGRVQEFIDRSPKILLNLGNGLELIQSGNLARRTKRVKIDVVFPAMHGTHGEDGELMGLLDMAGVPYVGCGVAASAIAMDKVLAKQVAASQGLSCGEWVWFASDDLKQNAEAVLDAIKPLQYPLFVKPAHMGSSIGITRVTELGQLMDALEVAAHYDDKVIVEEAVQNLVEVTLPIIGNASPVPAYLEQPLVAAGDFFDFEKKYMNGGKKGKSGAKGGGKAGAQGYSNIPADIPKDLYQTAEKLALDIYKVVGCSGTARVDMLIDSKKKEVIFNEINPMPGDLYAHNWQRKGVSNVELVKKLIGYAEERFAAREKLQTSFSTSYLKQF